MAVHMAVLALAVATGFTLVTSGPPGPTSAARAGSSGPGASSPVHGLLHGVAATSARNAWAVGTAYNSNILILHWNGTAWKRVPSPRLLGNLHSVAATSARNDWVVGDYTAGSTGGSLILHWNGRAWKRMGRSRVALGNRLGG